MSGTEKEKTVCFTGHRKMKGSADRIENRLSETVKKLIERGYTSFVTGGARGFDALAAETVLKLKETYPMIRLILILPFDRPYAHEKDWTDEEIRQYRELKEKASAVVVLADEYKHGIYHRRDRYMVDASSVCVAYLRRKNSGTAYTVGYAAEKGLAILNLAPG